MILSPEISRVPAFLPSLNRRKGPAGRNIELVVIHATAGAFAPSVDWLRNRKRQNRTSAHYVIAKSGAIIQLIKEDDYAWHAGYGRWGGRGAMNARSIGIELENANDGLDHYPQAQIESCLWLTLRACWKHGRRPENVVGHFHVDPERKTDPDGFPFEEFRSALLWYLHNLKEGTICDDSLFA